ncbi:hypothetical protein [Microbacterium sp.]|uniref:hypothetical protein n=1 Tax=Microbacterium sp. TaxID=51671 RepID=UPI0039E24E4D
MTDPRPSDDAIALVRAFTGGDPLTADVIVAMDLHELQDCVGRLLQLIAFTVTPAQFARWQELVQQDGGHG